MQRTLVAASFACLLAATDPAFAQQTSATPSPATNSSSPAVVPPQKLGSSPSTDAAHPTQAPATVPTPNTLMDGTAVKLRLASLTIDSAIPGADIETDGNFVGNTPSTVSVTPGQHTIVVKKKGYTDWTRPMNVSGTGVHVTADLDKTVATN